MAPPRNRTTRKRCVLSLSAAVEGVRKVAKHLEESARLTEEQMISIKHCFALITDTIEQRKQKASRQKNRGPVMVYRLFHEIRASLGLKVFLLCAIAHSPSSLQRMPKHDAVKLPTSLEEWWKSSTISSINLDKVAAYFEPTNKQIPIYVEGLDLSTLQPRVITPLSVSKQLQQSPGVVHEVHSTLKLNTTELKALCESELSICEEAVLILPVTGQPFVMAPVSYEAGATVIRSRLLH